MRERRGWMKGILNCRMIVRGVVVVVGRGGDVVIIVFGVAIKWR